MKQFHSLDSFHRHLEILIKTYKVREIKTAEFVGHELVKEARDKIGHSNEGAGRFKDWAPLAESTLADKQRKGYIFNYEGNPLYRTGELRDSIHSVYNPPLRRLVLGSDSEIMVYQELGTRHIPARSVIGLTMYQSYPLVSYTFGKMLVDWVSGKPLMTKSGLRASRGAYGSI